MHMLWFAYMQAIMGHAQARSHVKAVQNKLMEKEIKLQQRYRRELIDRITELRDALPIMRRGVAVSSSPYTDTPNKSVAFHVTQS